MNKAALQNSIVVSTCPPGRQPFPARAPVLRRACRLLPAIVALALTAALAPQAQAQTTPAITLAGTAGEERATLNWTTTGTFTALAYAFNDAGSTTSFGAWRNVPAGSRSLVVLTSSLPGRGFGVPILFKVRGRLADGTWVESNEATVTPLPRRVSGLSATAGNREVTLGWTPVSGGPITKYQYRQRDDGGTTWGAWTDASGTATRHTVTGLTAGTEYTFQVRLVSGSLAGLASNTAVARVSGITLTGTAGEERATLNWVVGGSFTAFQYTFNDLGSTTSFGAWKSLNAASRSLVEKTWLLPGRQFGVPIQFKLRGQLADGTWIKANEGNRDSAAAARAGTVCDSGW